MTRRSRCLSRVLTTSLDRDGQAGSGFRVHGLGFLGLEFRVLRLRGFGFRVFTVLGFRVYRRSGVRRSAFKVQGSSLGFRT